MGVAGLQVAMSAVRCFLQVSLRLQALVASKHGLQSFPVSEHIFPFAEAESMAVDTYRGNQ